MFLRIFHPILIVFCIFLLAGSGISFLLPGGSDNWLDLVHRAKRQANESEGESEANAKCVIRNLKDIESKLEKALPPEKNVSKAAALAKPHQIFSNADPNTLVKFCAIYKASRTRLAGCGESQMKSFASKALAVVDFVCIDRYEDFITAFPCIQKIDKFLDADCQKNCSEFESAAEKLNSAGASIVKKYNSREIKELFAQSCQYVSCFMSCQKPLLEKECGPKVLELEMSSIAITFKNLDDMMSQSSASNVWPQECKPLSSMGAHEKEALAPGTSAPSAPSVPSVPVNTTSHDNSTLASAPSTITLAPEISPKISEIPAKATSRPPKIATSAPGSAAGNSTSSRRLRSRTF